MVCKNCYGKGFASVMESIEGFADFGEVGFKTRPKVYIRFCDHCRKGKGMKARSIAGGAKEMLIDLFEVK